MVPLPSRLAASATGAAAGRPGPFQDRSHGPIDGLGIALDETSSREQQFPFFVDICMRLRALPAAQ